MKKLFRKLFVKDDFIYKVKELDVSKILYFKDMLDKIKDIDGDVVECGVGKALTLQMIFHLLKLTHQDRNLVGIDSFKGFPETVDVDGDVKKGDWAKMRAKDVYSVLDKSGVEVIEGFFDDVLPGFERKIALLHLDVDLYESYKICLKYLYPQVVEGGVVMFDEYGSSKFLGAKKQ